MALLLSSRGRLGSRKSGSFLKSLRSVVSVVLGRASWREERAARAKYVPGWLALVGVLAAFAGGFFAGGRLGVAPPKDGAGLQAGPLGVQPGVIDAVDTTVLTGQALIVSYYPGLPADEAKARAKALSDWLRSQGLERTRPYEHTSKGQKVWFVQVYYDGDSERQAIIDRVAKLQDVPDANFVQLRNQGDRWPRPWSLR